MNETAGHNQRRTGAWEGRMRISDVLRVEGTQVVTVTPDTKVRRLLAVLAEHRIGAVVSLTTAPRSTG
jgi:hypothetical protein